MENYSQNNNIFKIKGFSESILSDWVGESLYILREWYAISAVKSQNQGIGDNNLLLKQRVNILMSSESWNYISQLQL